MSIILGLLLAQAQVLPEIDRRSIEMRARAEALQPSRARQPQPQAQVQRSTQQPRATTPRQVQPTRQTSTPRQQAPVRRASGGSSQLDLAAITTICRAAGNQADPSDFLATLSRAYALSSGESASLRSNCAAYLAGRADARGGSVEPH